MLARTFLRSMMLVAHASTPPLRSDSPGDSWPFGPIVLLLVPLRFGAPSLHHGKFSSAAAFILLSFLDMDGPFLFFPLFDHTLCHHKLYFILSRNIKRML